MADQEKEILEEEMEQDLSDAEELKEEETDCLLYTSPSPRDS